MGLVVSDLIAKLGLDDSAFNRGMDQSEKKAMTFGDGLRKAQVGAAIGLAAVVGVVGKGVQSYETLTASVTALQRQTKVSAEDASLLVGQWQRYGVSAEAGGRATMMLSKQIDAANLGTKTSVDSFARLGITLNDLKTMSPYQVLEDVRQKLSEMPAGAERTSLSAKLLGRGFMSMSKWIAASSTDLDALNQQLRDTGQVMDAKELAKAKDDLKQMALLQVDLRGLLVEVGRSAMPIIRDLIPGMKGLLAVVKPLAPHLVQIGEALATFLVVSKVATGLNAMITALRTVGGLRNVLGAGGGAGGLGGLGGGAADAALKAAISLNTTATEANTLALGGKGIPGGGGGGVLNKALPVAEGAGGMTLGAAIGTAAATGIGAALMLVAPTVIGDALGKNSKAHQEFLAAGTEAGKAFATTGMGKGTQAALILTAQNMTQIQKLAAKGIELGDVKATHTDSQLRSIRDRIVSTLHVTQNQADAIMAGMFKDWRPLPTVMGKISPAMAAAERRINQLRAEAGKAIKFGNTNTTSLINSIARASAAFNGMSRAARTAGNAAANALAAASGTGGSSYRGHFMAAGGVVTRPQLTMLGEGYRPEAVIPLTNPSRAAQVMAEAGLLGGGGGEQRIVYEEHFHIHPPGGTAVIGSAEDVVRMTAPYMARAHEEAAAARARSR